MRRFSERSDSLNPERAEARTTNKRMSLITTFARRRRKVAVLRQNLEQLEPILNLMKSFFRILTCLALLITGALASLQYLAVLPPGTIHQDWIIKAGIAAVLLKGFLEGITVIGDIADDGIRNGSFKPGFTEKVTRLLVMLLFVGMVSFMLASCATSASGEKTFLGITQAGWVQGGKAAVISAAPVLLQERARTGAKQPQNVQP